MIFFANSVFGILWIKLQHGKFGFYQNGHSIGAFTLQNEYDATKEAPSCLQPIGVEIRGGEGQEDCLYLNVFMPNQVSRNII